MSTIRRNAINYFGDQYVYHFGNNNSNSVKTKYRFEQCRLYSLFYSIAQNRYIWEGLPSSIESRHIEKFMLEYGQVIFTVDKDLGLICLPCKGTNDLNIYGEHTEYQMQTLNGGFLDYTVKPYIRGEKFNPNNDNSKYGILLKEGNEIIPFIENVNFYSKVVEEFEMSFLMNLQQQRFTNMIPTNDTNKLSIKTTMGKIYDYEPFILANKDFTEEYIKNFKTIDFGVKYLLDKLHEDKQKMISEYLTLCGINNNPIFKKERMITDEVNSNNEFIEYMLQIGTNAREKVASELTKILRELKIIKPNDEIKVYRNKYLSTLAKEFLDKEVVDDGTIHTINSPNSEE